MVWFKIDDGFWSHPKVAELSGDAIALWVRAGAYCAGHLTDGAVKPSTLRMVGAQHIDAAELVAAGLWDETDSGWSFHDWSEYQPTREQVLADRAAATERKRRSREQSLRRSHTESHRDSRGVDAVIPASPTRPDPTRPDLLSPTPIGAGERAGRGAPLAPFCPRHPQGTDRPCRACGAARMTWEIAEAAEKNRPSPRVEQLPECVQHPGYPLPCHRCAEDARAAA